MYKVRQVPTIKVKSCSKKKRINCSMNKFFLNKMNKKCTWIWFIFPHASALKTFQFRFSHKILVEISWETATSIRQGICVYSLGRILVCCFLIDMFRSINQTHDIPDVLISRFCAHIIFVGTITPHNGLVKHCDFFFFLL